MPEIKHEVSVVILSYNRPTELKLAIESVLASKGVDLQVLVVDNLSGRSAEIRDMVAAYDQVNLLAVPNNSGFTGGMNRGLKWAKRKFILLTEDDIILSANCISKMAEYLNSSARPLLVSPVILNRSDNLIRSAGGDVDLSNGYLKKMHHAGEVLGTQVPRLREVSYLSGALLFGRSETWKLLNGFREDFFMYFEDDEICQRLRKKQGALVVLGEVTAVHVDPAPGVELLWLKRMKLRNLVQLYFLHGKSGSLLPFFIRNLLLSPLKQLFIRPEAILISLSVMFEVLIRLPTLLKDRRA